MIITQSDSPNFKAGKGKLLSRPIFRIQIIKSVGADALLAQVPILDYPGHFLAILMLSVGDLFPELRYSFREPALKA